MVRFFIPAHRFDERKYSLKRVFQLYRLDGTSQIPCCGKSCHGWRTAAAGFGEIGTVKMGQKVKQLREKERTGEIGSQYPKNENGAKKLDIVFDEQFENEEAEDEKSDKDSENFFDLTWISWSQH
jgi:hypothetical protein